MTEVRYIGSFPPPYGGVTVKNELIFLELSQRIIVKKTKSKNKKWGEIKNIFYIIFERKPFIIGISAVNGKSILVSKILSKFNRKMMHHSVYFMMGGLEAKKITESKNLIKIYRNYAKIYVETESMKECLDAAGLQNVAIFPNCRKRPKEKIEVLKNTENKLRCVFFSNIYVLKGVDIILDVALDMPNVEFYFYGHIDKQYKNEFIKKCSSMKNVFYKGIFKGEKENIYYELRKYDVMLFPTRWKNEGVPGVLVEGKIAGLAEVVTNICYNSELVENGVSGYVITDNNAETLKRAIVELDSDRNKLYKYKIKSQQSAEKYFIDNYINEIECILKIG